MTAASPSQTETTLTPENEGHIAATATHEGPAYWFFDCLAVIRSPETSRPIVIEMTVPPGGGAPLHVHANLDDSFYLMSGRVAVRCGDERIKAEPGDYVTMPHGVPQTFLVTGDEPAVMLQVHSDDSFLRFIKAVGKPAPMRTLPPNETDVDFDAVYRIAAETGQPVIGPPMTVEEAAEIAGDVQAVGPPAL